jgi:hypothetical protein
MPLHGSEDPTKTHQVILWPWRTPFEGALPPSLMSWDTSRQDKRHKLLHREKHQGQQANRQSEKSLESPLGAFQVESSMTAPLLGSTLLPCITALTRTFSTSDMWITRGLCDWLTRRSLLPSMERRGAWLARAPCTDAPLQAAV